MKQEKPTWRNTYNAKLRGTRNAYQCVQAARAAGYPFLLFDGSVFYVPPKEDFLIQEAVCSEADLDSPTPFPTPAKPLSQTAQIVLEYLSPIHAQTFLARLHNSLPSEPEQIREHLNGVHRELGDRYNRAFNELKTR